MNMRTLRSVVVCLWLLGLLHASHGKDPAAPAASDAATSAKSDSPSASIQPAADSAASKDKRQVGDKETALYPNHRSDSNVQDDLEDGQETIYGGSAKANRFLIRPLQHQSQKEDAEEAEHHQQQLHHSHQQQQHQQQQRSALLRNYPVTIRPHSTQQLEQSQEIQHFAYLQDLSRHQASKNAVDGQEKLHLTASSSATSSKKAARLLASAAQSQSPSGGGSSSSSSSSSGSSGSNSNSNNAEEAEQRYAVTVQAAPHPSRHYQPGPPYSSPGGQQPYQIIPEEHFLRLIEQELQARAYHEDQQLRHLQQQQQHQRLSGKGGPQGERGPSPPPPPTPGLGSYRQRLAENLSEPPPSAEQPQHYVQYVPRHRGGPKYLPLTAQEPQVSEPQEGDIPPEPLEAPQRLQHHSQPQPQEIPPQLAYYQPQISYKTLPNHPLAKSSLEKEIEKLLAANKPNVQLFDSNEHPTIPSPTLAPRHHHSAATKTFIASTTPNSLLDANNQPFIPSLFQFSNFQSPTPVYPTEVGGPQHGYSKKVGPVVYPQATPQPSAQPTQYYYQQQQQPQQQQDVSPSGKPKTYRSKPVYGSKVAPASGPEAAASLKPREKALASAKYPTVQTLLYEYAEQPSAQTGPVQFHPSPLDPTKPQPTPAVHHQPQAQRPAEHPPYRQYVLPAGAPSQSNIYVSQGTGVVTPSRPQPQPQHHHQQQPSHHSQRHHQAQQASSSSSKSKTVDDVKRLRLPSPGSGGKPLTQEEFQALVDAGYPVTAVPVPVPVPYDQYVKDHPEYRNQPVDYTQLMRLAQQQYSAIPQQHHHHQQQQPQHQQPQHHQHHQHRSLGVASEPSVKIISSPGATATGIGGGSITYLRPIASGGQEGQKRHPRNEKDTKVAGGSDGEVEKVEVAVEAKATA